MNKLIKVLLLGLICFNTFYFGNLYMSQNKSSISVEHPILINSDIELDDLIQNKFIFLGMPCGMITYGKTVKDTSIRYYLEFEDKGSIFRYKPNNDTSSKYYPFNKRLVKNSITRKLEKSVDIKFKETNFKKLQGWFLKNNAYIDLEELKDAILRNKNFYVRNFEQRLNIKCHFSTTNTVNSDLNGTLKIMLEIPYLSYRKYKLHSDLDEEISIKFMHEFNNASQ